MNKELIELYLEGFKKGYWSSDNKAHINIKAPQEWYKAVFALEDPLIDECKEDNWCRKENVPEYEEAARQWRKLKMSKLWQSIK